MNKFAIFLVYLISIVYLNSEIANSSTLYPNLDFLSNTSSMRSFSMGGTRITDISSESALFNPATLAFYHFDKTISYSFPTHLLNKSIATIPVSLGSFVPNLTYVRNGHIDNLPSSTWGVSFGQSFGNKQIKSSLSNPIYTLSAGYFEVENARGKNSLGNESGEIAKIYTVSLALDLGVKVGIGSSHKIVDHIDQSRSITYNFDRLEKSKKKLTDVGLYAEFPIFGSRHSTYSLFGILPNDYTISIIPSLAYSSFNIGASRIGGYNLNGFNAGPSVRTIGLSVKTSLTSYSRDVLTMVASFESQNSGGGYSSRSYDYYGGELGILSSIFLRLGSSDGNRRIGYGLNIGNLLNVIKPSRTNSEGSNMLNYLAKNLNMEFDWGRNYYQYNSGRLIKLTVSL